MTQELDSPEFRRIHVRLAKFDRSALESTIGTGVEFSLRVLSSAWRRAGTTDAEASAGLASRRGRPNQSLQWTHSANR